MKHFEIRITYNNGRIKDRELEADGPMEVATHIVADIRSVGYQKSDPTIKEVRYNEKGSKKYRYS